MKGLISILSVCTATVILSGCVDSNAVSPLTSSSVVSKKIAQTKKLAALNKARSDYGAYKSKQIRKPTKRDSGLKEAMLFLHNANFRFLGDIGFYAPKLIVSAQPLSPTQPVVFDDPASFELTMLKGDVIFSAHALAALLNDFSFQSPDAPFRNISARTSEGLLTLKGELNRKGKWVSFLMQGPVTLKQQQRLMFKPNRIDIDGKSADALLKAANINLDEILTIKAQGLFLEKNTIHINPMEIFPPPGLNLQISAVQVTEKGLELTIKSPKAPDFVEPPEKQDSYIFIRGGDVKFLNVMAVSSQILVQSDNKTPIDFSLYKYRKQLAAGSFSFKRDGTLLVKLKNINELEDRK